MANLLWKTKESSKTLLATPFESEEHFEKMVFETPEILEDVFLLKRQIRGGNKSGIPDIIGVDNDGNICIVEMKNIIVNSSIVPQLLEYAIWAEMNPDSIKALWLECDNKPENLDIEWESAEIRIIVIAPKIVNSTLDYVDKIDYEVELIEITRWVEDDNHIFLVNKMEREKSAKITTVRGTEVYDLEFYKKNFNTETAIRFQQYCDDLQKLVEQKGWLLERKFNKHYCTFKAGNQNTFGINWVGIKTIAICIKIPESQAKEFELMYTKYEYQWHQALYYIDFEKTKIDDVLPLLEKAYTNKTGKK